MGRPDWGCAAEGKLCVGGTACFSTEDATVGAWKRELGCVGAAKSELGFTDATGAEKSEVGVEDVTVAEEGNSCFGTPRGANGAVCAVGVAVATLDVCKSECVGDGAVEEAGAGVMVPQENEAGAGF